MPRRILIIQAHPDPDDHHLCHALADAYADAATAAGHRVARLDLASLDIPLLRREREFEHEPPPPSLVPAQQAIAGADHILLVFPLWLGTMPALVKAFLEQVMRPGFAFGRQEGGGFPRKLLAGRTARLVVTMGMPAALYRLWYGAHGLRWLERNILHFVGIRPVRRGLFGLVGAASVARREKWLRSMRRLGAKGA